MSEIHFSADLDASKLEAGIRQANKTVGAWVQDVEKQTSGIDKIMQKVGGAMAAYFSVQALANFGKQVIEVRGQFQQLGIAFETMLGSKEKADKLMQEAIVFAAKTPFTLVDVASNIKQLMAMGIATEDVMSTMKSLGDVAAGVSVPISRIAINYGQVATMGKLQGRELRDFAMAGVPLISELAKNLGKTKNEIEEMVSAGQIGFPMVEAAFKSMSAEGGKFFNLMEKQNKSVTGQISNLADKWSVMLNEIGKSNEGLIYKGIGGVSSLISNYKTVIEVVKGLVLVLGAAKVATILVAHEQKIQAAVTLLMAESNGFFVASEARAIVMKQRSMAAQEGLNKSMLANPYVLAAAAIAALGFGIYKLVTYQTDLEKATNKADIEIENEKDKVLELFSALKAAKDGTDGYKTARQNIINQYGDLIPEQLKELGNLIDINEAQLLVNKSLTENIALKTKTEALQAISSEYNPNIIEAQSTIIKRVERKLGEERAAMVKQELAGLVAEYKAGLPGAEKALSDYRQRLVKEVLSTNKGNAFFNVDISGLFEPLFGALKSVKEKTDLTIGAFKKYGEVIAKPLVSPKEDILTTAAEQRLKLKKQLVIEEQKLADIEANPGKDPLKAITEQEAVIKALKEQLKIEDKKEEVITEKAKLENKITEEKELFTKAFEAGNDAEMKAIGIRIGLLEKELAVRQQLLETAIGAAIVRETPIAKITGLKVPTLGTGIKSLLSNTLMKPNTDPGDYIPGTAMLSKQGEANQKKKDAKYDKDAEDSLKKQLELREKILNAATDLVMQIGQQIGLDEKTMNVLGSSLDGFAKLASGDYAGAAVSMLSGIIAMIPNEAQRFANQIEDINRLIEEQQRLIEISKRKGGEDEALQNVLASAELKLATTEAALENAEYKLRHSLGGPAYTKRVNNVKDLTIAADEARIAVEDAKQALDDFIIGGVTENTVADAITQGFQEGKTSVDDFAGYMNQVLTNAVLDIFKAEILGPSMTEATKFIKDALSDKILTSKEKADIDKMVVDIASTNEGLWKDLTQGLTLGGNTAQAGLTGIVRNMSEDTGNEMTGIIRNQRDDIRQVRDYSKLGIDRLVGIENNTFQTVVQLQLAVVELKNIVSNTKQVPVGAL